VIGEINQGLAKLPVKVAFKRDKEGRLQRVNKKTGKEITVAK
jgi:hypothetical protein